MDRFIKELMAGDIHRRDCWQFELKSEFSPLPSLKKNTFTEEFYFFIPNSLQINEETYSKKKFYQDRTNLIRYKTPEFELHELYDRKNTNSPLSRLQELSKQSPNKETIEEVEDELKLLGNMIRSSIRENVRLIVNKLKVNENIMANVKHFCQEIDTLRDSYLEIQFHYLSSWKVKKNKIYFLYLDEFISNTINYYLTGLLSEVRSNVTHSHVKITHLICATLEKERQYRKKTLHEPSLTDEDTVSNEFILYRSSLLNKFIMDILQLNTTGTSLSKRFQNIIGSISAGIAMLFFFVLFVWQGKVFIIDSLPFILITVFLYIIKDRIKEILRNISFQQFSRWFSDYKTDIRSPDNLQYLGKLSESASFVDVDKLPEKIKEIRNLEFHDILETIKRPEKVIYYKKRIVMENVENHQLQRRNALNLIFRYNISHFLNKADNPTHDYLKVDPGSFEFIRATLPKVYHLNIIIRNTYLLEDHKKKVELKKFRLILDKNGIKRVEHIKCTRSRGYHIKN